MNNARFFQQCNALAVAVAVACSSVAASAAAAGVQIECPASLSEQSIAATPPSADWRSHVSSPFKLTAAGFMGGPPETLTDLKPNFIKEGKQRTVVRWEFEGALPDGKWLSCSYDSGAITLSKTIDASITSCEVSYTRAKPGGRQSLEKIRCR